MAKAIISYDKDLPEIPDRRPWEKPTSFLVKDPTTETEVHQADLAAGTLPMA